MIVLKVNASPRRRDSVSRKLVERLVARLDPAEVIERDLAQGLPLLSEEWLHADWVAEDQRTMAQRDVLMLSDALVAEVKRADVLVFGVPVYNFSVPAALKAWIDLVARYGKTFSYQDATHSEGLLQGKRAFVIVASGGISVDDPRDHATPMMRTVLEFIGIRDVTVIDAGLLSVDEGAAMVRAQAAIDGISAKPA